MTDIFLSYNREDQARAKLFAEALATLAVPPAGSRELRGGSALARSSFRSARSSTGEWGSNLQAD